MACCDQVNQEPCSYLDVHVDTDHAGCLRTRKSTNGGALQFGLHTLKSWSSTQSVIALSSGESEYYGIVKGASILLGALSLAKDFGVVMEGRLSTDSSAGKGIASRLGLGKVRHLDVEDLWVQQKVRDGSVQLLKVAGVDNPADIFTKYVASDLLVKMLAKLKLGLIDGRPEAAPELPPERP